MSAVTPIKIGDHVKSIAIERYRGSEGHRDVIAIVGRDIIAAVYHYIPNLGMIYCFKGACCEDHGLPQLRYIFPIAKYGTLTDVRTRKYGGPMSVQYLSLGGKDYESKILAKDELQSDITMCDLLVSCQEESFQDLTFEVFATPNSDPRGPLWRVDAELNRQVITLLPEYQTLVELSIARRVEPDRYAELMEMAIQRAVKSTGKATLPTPRAHPRHEPPPGSGLLPAAPPLKSTGAPPVLETTSPPPRADVEDFATLLDPLPTPPESETPNPTKPAPTVL